VGENVSSAQASKPQELRRKVGSFVFSLLFYTLIIAIVVPGSDPNIYLTHRVVKVLDHLNDDKGLFFVTKGDANPTDIPPFRKKACV